MTNARIVIRVWGALLLLIGVVIGWQLHDAEPKHSQLPAAKLLDCSAINGGGSCAQWSDEEWKEIHTEVWNECPKTAHCFPPGVKGPYQR